jgi:hypothetical protein
MRKQLKDKGEMTVRYKDGAEVVRAGDAFYWPPAHTFSTDEDAKEDCVLIEFSELADFLAMEKGLGRTRKWSKRARTTTARRRPSCPVPMMLRMSHRVRGPSGTSARRYPPGTPR